MLKEKSEDLLNLKNKNKQLEQQKSALEVDCQNLEKLAEKFLGRLETISNLAMKKTILYLQMKALQISLKQINQNYFKSFLLLS